MGGSSGGARSCKIWGSGIEVKLLGLGVYEAYTRFFGDVWGYVEFFTSGKCLKV